MDASGQTSTYTFKFTNTNPTSPMKGLSIHTNRTNPIGNRAYLKLREGSSEELSDRINSYVMKHIKSFEGDRLVTFGDNSLHISVDASHVRGVIDSLFKNNEMSPEDRSNVEPVIRELEKSLVFASKRSDTITVSQKDIIQSFVSPYIEDIKKETSNSEEAMSWIERAESSIKTWGPSEKDWIINFWTQTMGKNQKEFSVRKSDNFYESLFAVAKIYGSMGDLESALEQNGSSLPEAHLIRQAIRELFN